MKKLNYEKNYYTIRWIGRDTRGLFSWIAFGDSYETIWKATVDGGINDADDEEEFRLQMIGKTTDDFWKEDGEFDQDACDDAAYSVQMTDEDYKALILASRGNAYYSTFIRWNGEEWEEEE